MGPAPLFRAALSAAFLLPASAVTETEMAAAHAAAAARDRPFVYNTDGCDMLYYPNAAEISVAAFCGQRLRHAVGTRISTVSYCPLASGFAYFTLLKAGDPLTNTVDVTSRSHNATLDFAAIGHDCLDMALDFSRTNGFERFMSIRMNDSHDGSTRPGEGKIHPLFSAFRRRHPEYLMGNPDKGEWPVVCRWQWTCVNFAEAEVRDYVRKFIRQFCENYDMEGIELDFCRHLNYFKSVAYGGTASKAELRQMSDLVRDLRAITHEYEMRRGHPILLTARVPDSPEFARDIGLDLDTWLREKSLDALICGCYFNLNDWQTMADFVHARGAKCYASIDESRIPGSAATAKAPLIPGRDTRENYLARYAAAISAGCDGIYLFNLEGGTLNAYTQVDPRETDGLDKIYFATERGKGGYEPTHYLKDGYRHMRLPRVDPAASAETHPKIQARPYRLELRIGDDFAKAAAKGLSPVVTVMALTDATEDDITISVGGKDLVPLGFEKGLSTFRADPAHLKRGVNAFEIGAKPHRSATLLDFAVKIAFEPASGENPKSALQPAAFDSRLNAFVWRNWGLVPAERMARTVGTTPERLRTMADEFGLASLPGPIPEWRRRGYITILRRNWHLLAYPQLCTLLDMTAGELAFRLKEDDFLFVKLGRMKPICEPLAYTAAEAEAGAAERKRFAAVMSRTGLDFTGEEPRFAFVEDLKGISANDPDVRRSESPFGFRLISSYFADYGDPLGDDEVGSFPEGLLEKLAADGVNAVWLHTVLRTLVKMRDFPEFGEGGERRMENLRTLVARARRHGIRVFLYMNEPRAMPEAFFDAGPERREMKGARREGLCGFCPSSPATLRFLSDALEQVFRGAPGLGGIFTITASENFCTCVSHSHEREGVKRGYVPCPRCSKVPRGRLLAAVNAAMIEGMRRAAPSAEALVWNWAWRETDKDNEADVIRCLPKEGVRVMSVSETGMPIVRGGFEAGPERDYSISTVGPGEEAKRFWSLAREAGIPVVAKVQANCSWELSPFPYLPVLDLVAEHAVNLNREKVDGVMLSWSLGCAPAPNLRVFELFRNGATKDEVLDRLARETYGEAAASKVRAAWTAFSEGFREFPFSVPVIYTGPQQMGPANPLYAKRTGWQATMVGIPYDDLVSWTKPYPPQIWIAQMRKVEAGFVKGCRLFAQAMKEIDPDADKLRRLAERDFALFRAETLHFRSAANQAEFVLARDRGDKELANWLADDEIANAKRLFRLASADSRIGYESSNHYFYLPRDLVEKIVSCARAKMK